MERGEKRFLADICYLVSKRFRSGVKQGQSCLRATMYAREEARPERYRRGSNHLCERGIAETPVLFTKRDPHNQRIVKILPIRNVSRPILRCYCTDGCAAPVNRNRLFWIPRPPVAMDDVSCTFGFSSLRIGMWIRSNEPERTDAWAQDAGRVSRNSRMTFPPMMLRISGSENPASSSASVSTTSPLASNGGLTVPSKSLPSAT